jgi:hypothetical protein
MSPSVRTKGHPAIHRADSRRVIPLPAPWARRNNATRIKDCHDFIVTSEFEGFHHVDCVQ